MANRFIAGLNSRLLALTIARRNVRRNPLQSLLIILVISMPVAVGALGLTTFQSTRPTPAEEATLDLGTTQAVVMANLPPSKNNYQEPLDRSATLVALDGSSMTEASGSATILDPRENIAGYKWLPEFQTQAVVKTATGQGSLTVIEGQPWAPELAGRYFDLTGRAPANDHELLVNKTALGRLGLNVGDKVSVIASNKKLTIVGTLEFVDEPRSESVLFALPGAISKNTDIASYSYFAVGSKPISWHEVTQLNKKGFGILSRDVIMNPPADADVPIYQTARGDYRSSMGGFMALLSALLLTPLVLLPVAVLAGSAFSFGARRQARTLAVISSLGARASMLRFMTVANGIVLGMLGGLLGVVLGAGGAAFLIPAFSDGSRRGYPGYHIPWGLLLLAVLAGAVIGAIVSVIPAFAAAKVDVLNTLRGVRRAANVKKLAGFGGLVVAAIGVAVALVCGWARTYIYDQIQLGKMNWSNDSLTGPLLIGVGLGAVVIVIGLLVASAWLLVFARALLRRISPVSNYATNDLIYNRKRYTAVIASVLATSFVAASLMGIIFSVAEQDRLAYVPQAESNQLVYDRGTDYAEHRVNQQQLDQKLSMAQRLLAINLETAKSVAQTKSAGLIKIHEQFADYGFGIDKAHNQIIGAEGQQPYLMRDLNYLCPYHQGSPIHEKYQAFQQGMNFAAMAKIDSMPQYQGCDNLQGDPGSFMVGTPDDLRDFLGGRIDAAAEKQLVNGGAVVFHRGLLFDGKANLNWYASGSGPMVLGETIYDQSTSQPLLDAKGDIYSLGKPSRSVLLPAVLSQTPKFRASMMISPQTADRLGISYHPSFIVANYEQSLTSAQKDVLNQALGNGSFTLEQGYQFDVQSLMWWFTLGAGFFVLASTGIALGLAQIESRADQSTLGSIGAPKRFRASVVGSQALILTLFGTVLGAAVGYFFAWAMVPSVHYSSAADTPLMVPIWQTLVMVVGIPLLAATAFWVGVPKNSKFRQRLSLD